MLTLTNLLPASASRQALVGLTYLNPVVADCVAAWFSASYSQPIPFQTGTFFNNGTRDVGWGGGGGRQRGDGVTNSDRCRSGLDVSYRLEEGLNV